MGGGKSNVEQPKVVRMPNPNDPAILKARQMAEQNALKRGGRQSTMLSDMVSGKVNGSQGGLGA